MVHECCLPISDPCHLPKVCEHSALAGVTLVLFCGIVWPDNSVYTCHLAGMLLGSVSQKVLANAALPVLVARPA